MGAHGCEMTRSKFQVSIYLSLSIPKDLKRPSFSIYLSSSIYAVYYILLNGYASAAGSLCGQRYVHVLIAWKSGRAFLFGLGLRACEVGWLWGRTI